MSTPSNGIMRARNVGAMILCLLALPWVGALGQSSPHAQPASEAAATAKASPAQVVYEHGRLTVIANGSSLSKILEQIHAKMGIVFEGKLPEDQVMGQYGPGYPRMVLKKLLEQTSYKYTMVSDGTPYSVTKVVLSLRSDPGATAEKSAGPAAATAATAPTAATVKSATDGSNGAVATTPYVVQSPGRPGVAAAAAAPAQAGPVVLSPDGSPYLKGTKISVRQSQQRTADAERARSERLTKEAEEADKAASDSNPK